MSKQTGRVVREVHDEPHLQGRRLTVRFLHAQVEERGLDPATVADRFDLDVAEVYFALAYYHDNPEEMATVEAEREAVITDAAEDPDVVTGPEDLADG